MWFYCKEERKVNYWPSRVLVLEILPSNSLERHLTLPTKDHVSPFKGNFNYFLDKNILQIQLTVMIIIITNTPKAI
jgi:hypothetical protein